MRVDIRTSGGTSVAIVHLDGKDAPHDATAAGVAEELLQEHCGVFLRGLSIAEPKRFRQFLDRTALPLRDYRHGNSPRTAVIDGVYTSTDYPASYDISLHNEMSYAATWPSRLFFYCLIPAETGGETHLSDARHLLRTLSEPVQKRFLSRGVLYRQNLHGGAGFGKSWQQTYDTDNRLELEAYLRAEDVDFEWLTNNALRTYQRRPASRTHGSRGFDVWFNQADQWHLSNLPHAEAQAMREIFEDADALPLSVTFGDGSPVPESDLAEVRVVAESNAIDIRWERGDLLVVDNMAALHGRRAYSGTRQVFVAMS